MACPPLTLEMCEMACLTCPTGPLRAVSRVADRHFDLFSLWAANRWSCVCVAHVCRHRDSPVVPAFDPARHARTLTVKEHVHLHPASHKIFLNPAPSHPPCANETGTPCMHLHVHIEANLKFPLPGEDYVKPFSKQDSHSHPVQLYSLCSKLTLLSLLV